MDDIEILTAGERTIPAEDVLGLYRAEGWWPERKATEVAAVLASQPAVGAWRMERLVRFARAITDGYFHAYLEDVVVDPSERHRGVGTALIQRLEEQLRGEVPLITLFCARDLVPFYESTGYRSTRQAILHRKIGRDHDQGPHQG